MHNDSTTQLVELARDGNAAALHALLVRYQPDVTKFARTICATPEDAEDAVQEALWIAAQRLGTLRVASTFTSWLFQVVKYECFRLFRKVRREQPIDQLSLQCLAVHRTDQYIMTHDIAKAIADLPPHYRQILVMRDVQGMTAPEVAATLGLTVEAVKSRLHRGRTILRVALHNWSG